jgi:hypothetical protein
MSRADAGSASRTQRSTRAAQSFHVRAAQSFHVRAAHRLPVFSVEPLSKKTEPRWGVELAAQA